MKRSVNLSFSGLFTALTVIATLVFLPIPMANGFINAGETIIFLACFFLPPFYAVLSASIGSMLADIILGYSFFAPFTFIIKAVESLVICLLINFIIKDKSVINAKRLSAIALFETLGSICMCSGYFCVNYFMYGLPIGIAELPFDALQCFIGIVISLIIIKAIVKMHPSILEKK